jgi:hypothetical protein
MWSICRLILVVLSSVYFYLDAAHAQSLKIMPHETDAAIAQTSPAHWVMRSSQLKNEAPLLVWLSGTNGTPENGPALFYRTVLDQQFSLIALSYNSTPAVSQVCVNRTLQKMSDCAARFRQQRVWGDAPSSLINDQAQDAIVARLSKLLQHLVKVEPDAHWETYLQGNQPKWERIVLAGQSQGGGMAAYLAQTRSVAGLIVFSGGWDKRSQEEIADWYARPSVTAPSRWFATYHLEENNAPIMAKIYQVLGIPSANVFALDRPLSTQSAHGEGIRNPAYQNLWVRILQSIKTQNNWKE